MKASAAAKATSTESRASANALQAKGISKFPPLAFQPPNLVVQQVSKVPPSGIGTIDVTEEEDYLPNCVDNLDPERKMYRKTDGITSGWNDTDLFYADGNGPLVQITIKMVNDFWDPKYEGFDRIAGPDWKVNCEDYAKGYAGAGSKAGDFTQASELKSLLSENKKYVLELGYHWMSLDKTGDNAVTIRQKDGESGVYEKPFDLDGCCAYVMDKSSRGGTAYKV
jgi:hypothetical protein